MRWCGLFGVAEGTARVALSRMVDRGELRSGSGVYELAGRVRALGVASLALFAAARKIPVAPEIRAHRFILVDARDKPIASWA